MMLTWHHGWCDFFSKAEEVSMRIDQLQLGVQVIISLLEIVLADSLLRSFCLHSKFSCYRCINLWKRVWNSWMWCICFAGSGGRSMRYDKRYAALPSPLTGVMFWRICLDEAQMVESTTAKVRTCHSLKQL